MPTMKGEAKIQAEAVRKLRRAGAKVTLFRIPGEGKRGDWRTILAPYTPDVGRYLRGKYPNVIIANEDYETAARDWVEVRLV